MAVAVSSPRRWTLGVAAGWKDRVGEQPNRDGEGDYKVSLREHVPSPNSVYEVLEFLGRGTFGQVVKCWKKDSNEIVAMKILKDTPSYAKQGQMEVDVLTKLSRLSAEEGNFVRAYESFQHRGHICIVFELLHTNLYDYLKRTRFEPLPLKYIRPIAQQVLCCLEKLGSLGLVHADLKPENIMLVDPDRLPFRVKVIDFGSAVSRDKASPSSYLQSRYYRAPEVVMGVMFDEAIDMWSLGCVLAELFLGWPLFPGACEFDQILYICQTLGPLPAVLLGNIPKVHRFFNCDPASHTWSLKTSAQYSQETGVQSKEARKYILTSLADIAQVCRTPSSDTHENFLNSLDSMEFVSLLCRMLTLDPTNRIKPHEALQMPFITMQHLEMHARSPLVWEWIKCMQVCRNPPPQFVLTTTAAINLQVPLSFLSSNCCTHMQLLPHTMTAATPVSQHQHYPIVHQGTHLRCHVGPSTFGYLPIAPQVPLTSAVTDRYSDVGNYTAAAVAAAAANTGWQDSCRSVGTTPQVVTSNWIQPLTPNVRNPIGVMPIVFPEQHFGVAGATSVQSTQTPCKLLPNHLPSYHPFSRL